MRIRRGLLSPDLKCPKCGNVSRQTIDVSRAAWIWPLAAGLFAGFIYVLRRFIYHESPGIFVLLVISLFGPFFIALRMGRKLVNIDGILVQQSEAHKWIIPMCAMLITVFLLAYYTHDWLNVVIGLIVWACYYYFSKKRD